MVMSAYEHFVKLEFWAEAVECLLVADRRVMAMDLIKERLEVRAAAPKLPQRTLCANSSLRSAGADARGGG